ncbi:MAG: hypothetical protein ABIH42_11480 [Planctomycetota bacterium]
MFEKYKTQNKERSYWGMSTKETIKVFLIILFAALCLIVLCMEWPTPPTQQEREEITIPVNKRVGDIDSQRQFEDIKQRMIDEQQTDDTLTGNDYPEPPTEFAEEPDIWNQVRDEAINVLEEPVLYYVLHQINSMTQEEVEKRVKQDGELTENEYGNAPGKYRGKFISVEGTLVELENRPIEPNRSGLNQIWVGRIYNQQNKKYNNFYFYITRKDMQYITQTYCKAKDLTRNGDTIRLDGIFVKLYRTEIEGAAGAVITYPFLIGRELIKIKEPTYEDVYPKGPIAVISLLLMLFIVAIFISIRKDKKSEEETKKKFLQHKHKHIPSKLRKSPADKKDNENKCCEKNSSSDESGSSSTETQKKEKPEN